jgi:hypothetical protein
VTDRKVSPRQVDGLGEASVAGRWVFRCSTRILKTNVVFVTECNGGVTNGDSIGGCTGGGGSASDSGDQMDADARAKELARRKEEAKRKRRKKKRTGSSLVSSCFQGETCAKPASFQALPQFYFGPERFQLNLNVTVRKWQVSMLIALVR